MKMHTFFLSNKALVIVGGALAAGGSLLFVSGLLIGLRSQSSVASGATPGTPALTRTASTSVSSAPSASTAAGASPDGASSAAPADGAWPFSPSSYSASPAAADIQAVPALPFTTPPIAPRSDTVRRAPSTGRATLTAYAPAVQEPVELPVDAPSEPAHAATDEATAYLVQVGTFRVEQHAQDLVRRLAAAGYHPSITVRQEGERELHVVRVGSFVGLDKAERAAARIGVSEQLAASVVVARR
jgi:cell division septation protein DedD